MASGKVNTNSTTQPNLLNPDGPDPGLAALLRELGYFNLKIIDGVVCGLSPFLFTVGLVVNIDKHGYERRYCYSELLDAKAALESWDGKDHPDGPWIKCKGRYQGKPVDLSNPGAADPETFY